MGSVPFFYRAAVGSARLAAPLLALGGSKIARGFAGRRRAPELLARWGEAERNPDQPVVWFHAASVGEALQAGAVIGALTELRPDLQVAFTYFSPSAEGVGRRVGAHVAGYLPWDLSGPVGRALDGVKPDVLVFTKSEVWPVLVEQAVRRGVKVAIVGAAISEDGGRTRWPASVVLHSTWPSLSLACANTEHDASRLIGLGVPEPAVRTTGDPGVDSAAQRAEETSRSSPTLTPFHADPAPTIVAGSTWPEDEKHLLPALADVRTRVRGLRVIVAAHEPEQRRVRDLLERLSSMGWRTRTLEEVESSGSAKGTNAVVVERVGVLAQLYSVGHVAYVGGGFGSRGVHSVLEPAAARVPVVVGPRYATTPSVRALVRAGGALAAPDRRRLADALTSWLGDRAAHGDAASRAFGYIEAHRGAAARTATLLDPLFARQPAA
jgi:3-deoxy-D-manno-octulosonic-acid transferase